MTHDLTPSVPDSTTPEIAFGDWIKDTRDRLTTDDPVPARARPRPRHIPKWVLAPLLFAAIGLGWLAWDSSATGPVVVQGRVHDIDGRPVASAWVFLVSDPAVETRTSSDGSFRLLGVPPGNQVLLIAQDGMGQEYRIRIQKAIETDMGDLVFRVPPMRVRRAVGGGAYWGKR